MSYIFEYTFFQNAIIGIIIISIAAAMIGTYIITRRLVAITGGITHACFGGLGLGYFLGVNPVVMASIFAIASNGFRLIIVSEKTRQSQSCGHWVWQ